MSVGLPSSLRVGNGAPSFKELRQRVAEAASRRLVRVPDACARCGNPCLDLLSDGCINCLKCGWTAMLRSAVAWDDEPAPILTRAEYGRLGAMTGNSHKTKAQIAAHMAKMRASRHTITKGSATVYGKKVSSVS